ncbi:hypothetical protein [Brevundimonas sp.]|uniref:hypothetical protein n=1 Tax=Brevundimonas sp. TaxID=1871086 RepID=UPI001A20EA8E|nr:hypothetical protein [Brevundimonas sp.]MBJ7485076.1 hypothetical protein [Brevundimonas sp.]
MTLTRRHLGLGAIALGATAALPPAAHAEAFAIRMMGQHRGVLRGAGFAIPTYHVNFVTSQQATSVASISARTRLAVVMVGPDQALMRRLTNEAYADLRSQMTAANLALVSIEETRAMTRASGMAELPGNVEIAGIGPGITIGSSLRKGWATFGPDAAPALTPLLNMRGAGQTGFAAMGAIAAMNALGPVARQPQMADKVAFAPSLVLDFARLEARRPGLFGGAASAGGNIAFGVLAASKVTAHKPAPRGPGTPGGFAPREDVFSPTPFAEVIEGGAAVRGGPSFSDTVDENYQAVARARGDAVMINVPVWEGLVRDAYRSYNSAIVEAIRSMQG